MQEDRSENTDSKENQESNNNQDEGGILDPQTLENLAAFLSRETEETNQDETHDNNSKKDDLSE